VYYKLPSKTNADDILQEIYMTAYQKLHTLKNDSTFRAWILTITRNKCNDYYRTRAKRLEIPLDDSFAGILTIGRFGITESNAVRETLDMMQDKDRQILLMYFFKSIPQTEIAKQLGIPIGTVKSRIFNAKQSFKEKYPYPPKDSKGAASMKTLPKYLPAYEIKKLDTPAFPVKWEELIGMFIVPRIGEKLQWAMYDMPSRLMNGKYSMEAASKAVVHGTEGVEIRSIFEDASGQEPNHSYIVQLTDTHCRYLAEDYVKNSVRHYFTFLDGDDFIKEWGMGEGNIGKETNLSPKGIIRRTGSDISSSTNDVLDVIGCYRVAINGKEYDTVCVMDVAINDNVVATEQYIDINGRTVLWRRFNGDHWAFHRYKQKWSEKLPDNEQILINGETYIHWYDCITDYIL